MKLATWSRSAAMCLLMIILLTVCFLPTSLGGTPAQAQEADKSSAKKGELLPMSEEYRTVAEKGNLELQIRQAEEVLDVAVLDRESGQIWRAVPEDWKENTGNTQPKKMEIGSLMMITYMDITTQSQFRAGSLAASYLMDGVTVETITDGVRVTFKFPRAKENFVIPVEFTLTDKGLRAELDFDGIEESGSARVLSIDLLPFFGAGRETEEGYLFVPDGCGALVEFNSARRGTTPFSQPVYGRDPVLTISQNSVVTETVRMPVFGIKREKQGVFAIIEEGAALTRIDAYSSGIDTTYNNAYASFTYHNVDSVVIADKSWNAKDVLLIAAENNADAQAAVHYFLLPEGAGYMEMAEIYRAYLMGQVNDEIQTQIKAGLYLETYGAVKVSSSFLGFVGEKPVAMTTFEQAGQMLSELHKAGVEGLRLGYKGWIKGGMDDAASVSAAADSRLGGKKDLLNLFADAEELKIPLYPDVEFQKIYKDRFGWWSFQYAARSISRAPAAQYTYQLSTYFMNEKIKPYYLMAPTLLSKETDKFLASYKKLEITGLSASGMGNLIYASFSSPFTNRESSLEVIKEQLEKMQKNVGTLSVEGGNDYALPYADEIVDVPLFESGYELCSTDIPFYSLVLHGIKNLYGPVFNLSEDPEVLFLRLIETGVNPRFVLTWQNSQLLSDSAYNYLTSTSYDDWKDVLVERAEAFQAVHGDLAEQLITNYELLTSNLRAVTYEDGTVVIVNYSDIAADYKGRPVDPMGYLVVKGD